MNPCLFCPLQPSKALGDLSSLLGSLDELGAGGEAGGPSTSGRGCQQQQQQKRGRGGVKGRKERPLFGEAV